MPNAHRVTLITRPGCHLCDVARHSILRIAADTGSGYDEVDIDGDRELTAEYGDRVPVILVDGAEHGYGQVEEVRLRRELEV